MANPLLIGHNSKETESQAGAWCDTVQVPSGAGDMQPFQMGNNGRIRLSVSTASRTYELSEETPVTPFRMYRFHSTGLCNYKP